jgi:hypothetical protein
MNRTIQLLIAILVFIACNKDEVKEAIPNYVQIGNEINSRIPALPVL